MKSSINNAFRLGAGLLFAATAINASAQVLRSFAGSTANTFAANDDNVLTGINIGFGVNFFGNDFTQLNLSNNGNVQFSSSFGTFTPFNLTGATGDPIIAPFFADVDTRAAGSNPVTYGTGTLGGFDAFAANWDQVGVYNQISIFNTFQLVLINRSDTGAGNFDFEFNYSLVNWETGTASGGSSSGLGGISARAGYNSGTGTFFELTGSGVNGGFLDTNLTTGLIYNQLGTPFDGANMAGRYDFQVRNGNVTIEPPTFVPVPEPSTYGLMAVAMLAGLVALRRRKQAAAL